MKEQKASLLYSTYGHMKKPQNYQQEFMQLVNNQNPKQLKMMRSHSGFRLNKAAELPCKSLAKRNTQDLIVGPNKSQDLYKKNSSNKELPKKEPSLEETKSDTKDLIPKKSKKKKQKGKSPVSRLPSGSESIHMNSMNQRNFPNKSPKAHSGTQFMFGEERTDLKKHSIRHSDSGQHIPLHLNQKLKKKSASKLSKDL